MDNVEMRSFCVGHNLIVEDLWWLAAGGCYSPSLVEKLMGIEYRDFAASWLPDVAWDSLDAEDDVVEDLSASPRLGWVALITKYTTSGTEKQGLVYVDEIGDLIPAIQDLIAQWDSPEETVLEIDPAEYPAGSYEKAVAEAEEQNDDGGNGQDSDD